MNKNVHPIVANIVNQKTLCLAVNADNSVEFLNDLQIYKNIPQNATLQCP